MTQFDYHLESIATPALSMQFYFVPWDSEILGMPTAEIARLRITDHARATNELGRFWEWCAERSIRFCHCRLDHDQMAESMLLERHGFRFVELNYRPFLERLQERSLGDDTDVIIVPATDNDRDALAEIAGTVFRHGRLHQDPRLGPEVGNRRYRQWLLNAFANPHQQILKCILSEEISAFFVIEHPEERHCFWSLIGLAPGKQGKGLGKRLWRAMLRRHQLERIGKVSTSISSHNIPVMNLYVSLGFRFPAPAMSFQWLAGE